MTIYYRLNTYRGFEIQEPDSPEKQWHIVDPVSLEWFAIEADGEEDCCEWIDEHLKTHDSPIK